MAVTAARGFDVATTIGAGVLCVPLARRTRRPSQVALVVSGAAVAYLALTTPTVAFLPPLLLALYSIAANGTRRGTLRAAAAVVPYAVTVALVFTPVSGTDLAQVLQLISQLGFSLALGEAVRTQRALLAAVRERAERAERERELETRRRVDEERVRIARDVHDVVSHSIATIATQAAVGVHLGADEPERLLELLGSIKEVSAAAMHDVRHAVGLLRTPDGGEPIRPTPSVDDVADLVRQARESGLTVVLRMEGSPAALPTAVQVTSYRIVQEALTNVMRHAAGAEATVRIAIGGGRVQIEVTDDGARRATTPSPPGQGAGLTGMRERAAALSGTFQAGRLDDGGWGVRTTLPLDGDRR